MFQDVNLQCGSFKGIFMIIEKTCLRTTNCGDVSEIILAWWSDKANITCDFTYITNEYQYFFLVHILLDGYYI